MAEEANLQVCLGTLDQTSLSPTHVGRQELEVALRIKLKVLLACRSRQAGGAKMPVCA